MKLDNALLSLMDFNRKESPIIKKSERKNTEIDLKNRITI